MEFCYEIVKAVGNWFYHVSPALAGVILGGFALQKYWISRANEAVVIDYFSRRMDTILEETLQYWSLNCDGDSDEHNENREKSAFLGHRIKGGILNLNLELISYAKRYCNDENFTPLVMEVLKACTGGQFEVARRAADPHPYLRALNSMQKVRWRLFERRV